MFRLKSREINSEKQFESRPFVLAAFVACLLFNCCLLVFPCDITDTTIIDKITVVIIAAFYTSTDILVHLVVGTTWGHKNVVVGHINVVVALTVYFY